MIHGNWVAVCKNFKIYFPKDRPFTKLEAVFSLAIDVDNRTPISYSGYAKLWGWSRNKVKKFMDELGIKINPPATPLEAALQKGQPKGQPKDTPCEKKGQPRFIFDKDLYSIKDTPCEKKGQLKDTPKDTTIDPINPNPKNTSTQPPKSKKEFEFEFESIEMKICRFLVNVLRKSEPEMKDPNWQIWCVEIDRLLRIDKKTPEEIKEVILYAHDPKNSTEKFSWIPNLRSPKSLRSQFTKIQLTMKNREYHLNNNQSNDDGSEQARRRLEQTKKLLEENAQ